MSKKCCGRTYMDADRFCAICGKELINLDDDIVDDFYEEEEESDKSDTTIDKSAQNQNDEYKKEQSQENSYIKDEKEQSQENSYIKDEKEHSSKTSSRLKIIMIAMLAVAVMGLALVGVTTVKEVINAPYKEYIKSNNKERESTAKDEDNTEKSTVEGTSGGDESPSRILND